MYVKRLQKIKEFILAHPVPDRIYTDRSRTEDRDRCRRLRYLAYHAGRARHGIRPTQLSIHLVIGLAMHAGLAVLLGNAQDWLWQNPDLSPDDLFMLRDTDGVTVLRHIENRAVEVAIKEMHVNYGAGVELDTLEIAAIEKAMQAARTEMAGALGVAGTTGTAGAPQEDSPIEITFEGLIDDAVSAASAPALDHAHAPAPTPAPAARIKQDDWSQSVLTHTEEESATLEAISITTPKQNAIDTQTYLRDELAALIEGMLRAYARRRLRPLLEQFEILEVEREGSWKLGEIEEEYEVPFQGAAGQAGIREIYTKHRELWWASRHDGLLRERTTGYLYVLSYKTTGSWDRRKEQDAMTDQQGLSEAVDIDNRLGEAWRLLHTVNPSHINQITGKPLEDLGELVNERVSEWLITLPEPPCILGVRYEYLLKGQRREDKDASGPGTGTPVRYVQDTPLIRAYKTDGITLGDRRWATHYNFYDSSRKSRRLDYRTWKKSPVWQTMSIAQWIDMLDAGEVQPEAHDINGMPLDTLADQFIDPVHVFRNDDDMRDWLEQTEATEVEIAERVTLVEEAREQGEDAYRSALNRYFPQARRACSYPSLCPMHKICYGNAEIRRDPEATEFYVARQPNHPIEATSWKEGNNQ